MASPFHRAALAAAALAACSAAPAWTPETRARMADEAVRLMPHSLRLALESHREPLLRGMLSPMADEEGPAHLSPAAGGALDRSVDRAAAELLRAVETPAPFGEIAERFGNLAHYVADAGFPPGAGGTDGLRRYRHFAAFCDERRPKFPLVFYGHDDEQLTRRDYAAFTRAVSDRAAREDAELARAYAAAGDPPSPAAFDDRSVPFAIGSLSYSRTITDIVRVWIAAWEQAGGDTGRTPYRSGSGREQDRRRP